MPDERPVNIADLSLLRSEIKVDLTEIRAIMSSQGEKIGEIRINLERARADQAIKDAAMVIKQAEEAAKHLVETARAQAATELGVERLNIKTAILWAGAGMGMLWLLKMMADAFKIFK
jgi:hypothetical protein